MLILPSAVWSGSAGREMGKAVLGRKGCHGTIIRMSHIHLVWERDLRNSGGTGCEVASLCWCYGPGQCVMSVMLFGMTQWCIHIGYGRPSALMPSKSYISKFLMILVNKVEPI